MVKLYTWAPATVADVIANDIGPDLGHCSLEVVDADGRIVLYASYWPELDSVAGRLTDLLKHRETRQPLSYRDETANDLYFMQRDADGIDEIGGLDENRIVWLWNKLRDTTYQFQRWNCSNVSLCLLLNAMNPEIRETAKSAAACDVQGLISANGSDDFAAVLRYVTTAPIITCRPDDVSRVANAYKELMAPGTDSRALAKTA